MRTLLLLVLALPLAAQVPPRAARVFRTCRSCHGVPHPELPGDRLWITRIRLTACVQPPAPGAAGLRRALIRYLRAPGRERPRIVRAAAPRRGEGRVRVSFAVGSVLLVPLAGGDPGFRLMFCRAGDAVPVPGGRYRVRNYRVRRRAGDGTEWQLWASGGEGPVVSVRPGGTTQLRLEDRVHVRFTAARHGRELRLSLALTGHLGMGATVLRGGQRVPARAILFAGGETRGRVPLDYG